MAAALLEEHGLVDTAGHGGPESDTIALVRRTSIACFFVSAVLCAGCSSSDAGSGPGDASKRGEEASVDVVQLPDAPATESSSDGPGDEPDAQPDTPDSAEAGPAPFGEDPIVFVHGYLGGPGDFDQAIEFFRKAGYPDAWLRAIKYDDNTGSNVKQAAELEAFVEKVVAELGVDRVDIVAHSSGGVSSRWYVRFLSGKQRVRDYVSLAGAHHGNDYACFFPTEGGKELCPSFTTDPQSVLGKLNGVGDPAGDETPFGAEAGGPIHWKAFWSTGDIVISPKESECLDQASKKDCSAPVNKLWQGVAHNDFPKNAAVLSELLTLLKAHNAASP